MESTALAMEELTIHEIMDLVRASNWDECDRHLLNKVIVSETEEGAKFPVDKERIGLLLARLIRNNLVHCEATYVEIQAHSYSSSGAMYIYINDNGIGLGLEALKLIFEQGVGNGVVRSIVARGIKPMCDDMGIRLEHSTAEGEGFATILFFDLS